MENDTREISAIHYRSSKVTTVNIIHEGWPPRRCNVQQAIATHVAVMPYEPNYDEKAHTTSPKVRSLSIGFSDEEIA